MNATVVFGKDFLTQVADIRNGEWVKPPNKVPVHAGGKCPLCVECMDLSDRDSASQSRELIGLNSTYRRRFGTELVECQPRPPWSADRFQYEGVRLLAPVNLPSRSSYG